MLIMPKFRVSLLSLTLLLAVPFAPQALAKTSAAVTASQPDIASGSAMLVDLQTNKVKYLIGKVSLIQSVGSVHLGEAIAKEAEKRGVCQDILHLSDEKMGVLLDQFLQNLPAMIKSSLKPCA